MALASKVLVYGASGHGKVVAEVARALGHEVVGFIDDGVAPGTRVLGVAVDGDFAWLVRARPDAVIALGVGANATRLVLAGRVVGAGFTLGTFVHPRAWVSPSATPGAGTVVMANAVVNADTIVGEGVILNTGAIVEHDCTLGRFAHVSPNAALGGGVTVGECSQVGLGASVRPLARIGRDCVVGAGSVVLDEVPDGAVVAGVPTRLLR
jgi:sugar O-acyltransferase (sialic acid O-acetyltransferase NeuD family)